MNKRKLEDILDGLRIPLGQLGYKYWISAVKFKIESPNLMMGEIYKNVAKEYGTTPVRVERNLRHTYEHKKDFIRKYFGVDCNIGNSTVLALLAREMEREEC